MNRKSTFSLTKGYTFLFEEDGATIEAWFSVFSGLEKVYVNGVLVASQRNLSLSTANRFSVGQDVYSTHFKNDSILEGPIYCTLRKNDKNYRQQKLTFPKAKPATTSHPFMYIFPLILVLCILFTFALSYLQLPTALNIVLTALVFLGLLFYYYFKFVALEPEMEEVEIIDQ